MTRLDPDMQEWCDHWDDAPADLVAHQLAGPVREGICPMCTPRALVETAASTWRCLCCGVTYGIRSADDEHPAPHLVVAFPYTATGAVVLTIELPQV